jgi:AcrR family transcriptional regulator
LNNCVYFFTFLATKGRTIHRGELLETAVRESATNITQMVKKMGISRGTFYNHVKDPQLSFETLARYGQVIKHDFSQDLPDMKRYAFEEPEAPYGLPQTLEEAIEQRDYWRERYYQKAEEYNQLVLRLKIEDSIKE